MSHCTSFAFAYRDEQMAVRAFRRLGLQPSTEVIAEVSNALTKMLAPLGHVGKRQMRAIIAASRGYKYFLCNEGNEYKLFMEKHGIISAADREAMAQMEAEFRLTYIGIALEDLGSELSKSGTLTRFSRETDSILLQFGPTLDRSIRLTMAADGTLQEDVSGVLGSSCENLTAQLESLLSSESAELTTQWKPEYSQTIDDEVVQVLRLGK